jgi:UDP-sulfoquinovose synthase
MSLRRLKVFVVGGDGFCGWPAALALSKAQHEVIIVDSLVRRKIDQDLGVQSLTPIATIVERIAVAQDEGLPLRFVQLDLARDYEGLCRLLVSEQPNAVVHLAEQRSAPYSMKSSYNRRYTVENNVCGTHNLLSALVDTKVGAHLVHLGTMGVYGYNTIGTRIPEGYLDVSVPDDSGELVKRSILYPADPGSIYHMTKTQDQLLFYFYNKNFGLPITDLHQGVIWGTNTELTLARPELVNRFDYDGDFGTVLNRFLMQAALGYPLTIHGSGGQERAFIHITDSARCIQLAVENPPMVSSRVRIFNQATEVHQVARLAEMISEKTGVPVQHLPNPRIESEDNKLKMVAEGLVGLGLEPTRLSEGLMDEIIQIANKYLDRADVGRIPCTSTWRA